MGHLDLPQCDFHFLSSLLHGPFPLLHSHFNAIGLSKILQTFPGHSLLLYFNLTIYLACPFPHITNQSLSMTFILYHNIMCKVCILVLSFSFPLSLPFFSFPFFPHSFPPFSLCKPFPVPQVPKNGKSHLYPCMAHSS